MGKGRGPSSCPTKLAVHQIASYGRPIPPSAYTVFPDCDSFGRKHVQGLQIPAGVATDIDIP
jgi:hypothetical protein